MKRIVLSLAASVAAIALAPSANAAICIGVGFNGGAVTSVACDGGTGLVSYTTNNGLGGYVYNVGASGYPVLTQPNLLTQSVNILSATTRATNVLNVYITETDLSSFNGGLLSTFTSNTMSGTTAVISSYYSASNALWGGTLLQSSAFANPGVGGGGNVLNVAGLFSTTVRYDITFNGPAGSNFNGTANLAAVPEPATWGLMLLGFA
jgi:hypothetical protein